MLARAHAFTIDGLQTRHVSVEVDVRAGLPAFAIVGLADAAVREARERIHAAIRNSGYEFPVRRITANLAPEGSRRRARAGLGARVRVARRQRAVAARGARADGAVWRAGLDGTVRPSPGTLAVAQATREPASPSSCWLAPARTKRN